MEIRQLDPHDEPQARQWYEALYEGAAAGRVAPLVVSETALLTSLRSNDTNPGYDRCGFGAWEGPRCLGTAMVDLPRADNTHFAEIDINVRPEDRGRGVGAALYDAALAMARAQGRTLVWNEVYVAPGLSLSDSPGGRFALARGFASKHTEERLLLEVPLDEPTLAGLEQSAQAKADGYQVVGWHGIVPARWLGALAEMQTLMTHDVPSGDSDREPITLAPERVMASQTRMIEQGYGLLTTLALDSAGRPAAYTEMYVTADRENVHQDDTFVLRAHRGHRLGTLVKAANLRLLAEHYPGARYVHTWTAHVNDAMRAINERFGFRAVETMHEVEAVYPT
ncbi:GNAT family N-acetyltransferase [Allorhizocola rhizosphaerae]|uniref:GNAT family N-acetyltransferase n=1 Tax=Allorhizocola rhizosphaerae TaxID=1872709 RepID=UPI000E3D3E0D|nr:GNAT family N-acetyltransferase [Allorhizocola rhizosphaerae]